MKNYYYNNKSTCGKNGNIIPQKITYNASFWHAFRLIEECWDPEPSVRPTFSEIIVRLDKIVANCSKQGWWKDTFKLPWYVYPSHLVRRYALSLLKSQAKLKAIDFYLDHDEGILYKNLQKIEIISSVLTTRRFKAPAILVHFIWTERKERVKN